MFTISQDNGFEKCIRSAVLSTTQILGVTASLLHFVTGGSPQKATL